MLNKIYSEYFTKDKPLRHYAQHLVIAIVTYFLITLFLDVAMNFLTFILFILVTYIIDLDGLFAFLANKEKIPEAQNILEALSQRKYKKAMTLTTKNHKKLDNLYLHNILGFIFFAVLLISSAASSNDVMVIVSGAVISHFIFDIWDDIYQIGHMENWLWPLNIGSE